MNITDVHPMLGWPVIIGSLISTFIYLAYFLTDIVRDLTCLPRLRKAHENARWLHDAVIRYLTIPYLICLGPKIIHQLFFLSEDGNAAGFWDILLCLCYTFIGWLMWRKFKNRKNKRKIKEKVLAKVKEFDGKLVVVPVGAR